MSFQECVTSLLQFLQKESAAAPGPDIDFKGPMPVGFYGGGMTNARPPILVQSKKKKKKKFTKRTT